jgi:hypothetical protein
VVRLGGRVSDLDIECDRHGLGRITRAVVTSLVFQFTVHAVASRADFSDGARGSLHDEIARINAEFLVRREGKGDLFSLRELNIS